MGILANIKEQAARSGGSRRKVFYVRKDSKRRIRFLEDMDDGLEVTMHERWDPSLKVICREHFGKDCQWCSEAEEDETLRTSQFYCWSVYDYEDNDVKLFYFKVNRCSPIPPIVSMYETYGTLLDRDFVIERKGSGIETTYTVVPMDKAKFRNNKAKPIPEMKKLKILKDAFPYPDDVDIDDARQSRADHVNDDDDDDYDASEGTDYESMTPKQLYDICVERGIEAQKRKPKVYYINLIEEWDEANDDWGDVDDDDDEWEEDND